MKYDDFLKTKKKKINSSGFEVSELNNKLFPFQKYIVRKALLSGKYAVFADCGLGKSLMQLEWAYRVSNYTNNPVLILAPLAVVEQTKLEASKFGVDITRLS